MSATPDGAELKRVNSYQWPAGHVGHITENQRAALASFKTLAESKGYYSPGTDHTAPTHDDETLLRYLRARKFIPQEAFTQFKSTEDWRKQNQLDTLYETIDIEEYEQTRSVYPQWTGRRDKRGIPFYIYEIGKVDSKQVTAHNSTAEDKKLGVSGAPNTPRKMLRLFALYENLCRFVLPLCSAIPDRANPETPISQSSNVVDLSHVSIAKFWSLRNHMSEASTLATAHYPETLDRIFVVGAPSFFPTVWSWAQRWFDPITVSKIFILSNKEMASTLAKYVDLDNVPKKYGGNLDWNFGDMPSLEPAIVNTLNWREGFEESGHKNFPRGPITLRYDEKGDLVAVAMGSENGKPRSKVVAGLHPNAGVAPLALSPGRIDAAPTAGSVNGAAVTTPAASNETAAPTASKMDSQPSKLSNTNPAVPESSRAGTYTVPYRDDENQIAHPPADSRQGTSSTRYEQQEATHAAGQLADGTPEVRVDSQGEKQSIMEPNTVGQAPKDHPIPSLDEPQPTVMEQAQNMAGQAYAQASQLPSTIMAAVGMGGGKTEEVSAPAKKEDPEIDNMENRNVEEYLRSQTLSQPSGT